MRYFPVAMAAAIFLPGVARADDKPVFGPPPIWVKPVKLSPEPAKADDSAVRVILQDQQARLEPGHQSVYFEFVIKIQSPQGLSAGNISLPWRPDTDVLTVHKVHIKREDQIIDVLAAGQTFTVIRREQNLENAVLDGLLTANIQPEGLQVGDILEFAATIVSSDPTLKNHVEQVGAMWDSSSIDRAHLHIEWPSSLPIRIRQTAALPAIKTMTTGKTTSFELSLDNTQPVIAPKGAPQRYSIGRLVEATDFAGWADLAALMAPLYAKASTLPAQGPLLAELERIRALSPNAKIRAEAALALVQDRVRYVALAFGAGGLVPADTATTWARRFGDCKGKTVLLLGLLHALGIQAEPVLVNTTSGDGLDQRLPMVGLFNHVLVRATIGGKVYWLDGTRTGDTNLERINTPAYSWGLPIMPSGAALIRLMPPPLEQPSEDVAIKIDATAGLTIPAPIKIKTIFRGDGAFATNVALTNMSKTVRETALRDYWKNLYDFVEVKSVTTNFDAKLGELNLLMDGIARMEWKNGWYETDGTGVGFKANFSRDAGQDQTAPFAVAYPYYTKLSETILLPPGFKNTRAVKKADVNETVAGIEYRRHAEILNGVFTIEKTERSVVAEFPAKDAVAAQSALRRLADLTVYLQAPSNYTSTKQEEANIIDSTPKTIDEFMNRGNNFAQKGDLDSALKDYEHVISLDQKNISALVSRGVVYVLKEKFNSATKDFDAAYAIDPLNPLILRGRGIFAEKKLNFEAALAAYTTAIERDPKDYYSLTQRAQINFRLKNEEAAFLDAGAALKLEPQSIDLYLLRANILIHRGKKDAVAKEAMAAVAANPKNQYARVVAAKIYAGLGKNAAAMREYDIALAIKPEAYIYINRSQSRPRSDFAGRRADVEAALKLEPTFSAALTAKAQLQLDEGNFAGAISSYSEALKDDPGDKEILAARGTAYAKSGNQALAEKDFAELRAKASSAAELNKLCRSKATAGLALDAALADCNAALIKEPENPAALDNRGFVFLRLGRLDEAIADYDRALAIKPAESSSLFGRAVAWARKGNKAKSAQDAAAAKKISPPIQALFKAYGIKL
ncbi:MAG: tetratricopeptide repeat protein [Sphingomonas sp.]